MSTYRPTPTLIGKAMASADPDQYDRLIADGTIRTHSQFAAWVRGCDPEQYESYREAVAHDCEQANKRAQAPVVDAVRDTICRALAHYAKAMEAELMIVNAAVGAWHDDPGSQFDPVESDAMDAAMERQRYLQDESARAWRLAQRAQGD